MKWHALFWQAIETFGAISALVIVALAAGAIAEWVITNVGEPE